MYEIVEEEYQKFLYDFAVEESIVFARYVNEDDYEDEYSHNDIESAQGMFIEKARAYLHNNAPGEYVITSGWCVFIMTVEEAKKRKMHKIENYIVE